MKIAVTAANGNLGSAIVRQVVKLTSKDDVVAIARTPKKAQFLADELGVEIRKGDYEKQEEFEQALKDIDTVLIVSSMAEVKYRVNQHRNVINAAKTCGVRKIVYVSIQGAQENTGFSHVVQSNRQTEEIVKNSGLEYAIGRNGIYIEPDIEYIETYKKDGVIKNCAGDGKCGYTTRDELAYAFAKMILEDKHNENTYNLHGEAITQEQLTNYMNETFGTNLRYVPLSFKEYKKDRIDELGEYLGTVIAGIYDGISKGAENNPSDYKKATGREHQSWDEYFKNLKA